MERRQFIDMVIPCMECPASCNDMTLQVAYQSVSLSQYYKYGLGRRIRHRHCRVARNVVTCGLACYVAVS